ncbi:uncharacterized protein ARMOST_21681 [Armillaria ostoyae]|uniref:Uncharacterized protein n=1 Tax=Armillaria ostoyae TaxID=47428 RepID=A0A284SAX2_ARMOS|nr:uncharacterized protein ARMOST_21681 [Armillaria ostoyae]
MKVLDEGHRFFERNTAPSNICAVRSAFPRSQGYTKDDQRRNDSTLRLKHRASPKTNKTRLKGNCPASPRRRSFQTFLTLYLVHHIDKKGARIFNIAIRLHIAARKGTTLRTLSPIGSIAIQADVRRGDRVAGGAHRGLPACSIWFRMPQVSRRCA